MLLFMLGWRRARGALGCCDTCGYKWDNGRCTQGAVKSAFEARTIAGGESAPIIGGSGKFRYQYMPDLLKMEGASLVNCHGLVTDKDNNI